MSLIQVPSAEGRTVRAHRVVLSACSTFFSDLFRTLDPPFHPVIVLPGASFGAMVALLTFMYSGEVNVFEGEISSLLSLAETLGIKGLADFHGNVTKMSPKRDVSSPVPKEPETPSPTPTPTPTPTSTPTPMPSKLISPLENLFAKTFQFCPSLMANPLNFSQSAISRGAEIFARYQNQCRMNQMEKGSDYMEENGNRKSVESKKTKTTELKKIDQIAEQLRSGSSNRNCMDVSKVTGISHSPTSAMLLKSSPYSSLAHFMADDNNMQKMTEFDTQEPTPQYLPNEGLISELDKAISSVGMPPKTSNSKLYATCFICHKQLSNQYNLRVHLETHQNVRYACSVCSHVSRSKDALRKHISYRHPGAPSPCESESRRKRMKIAPQVSQPVQPPVKQESNYPSTSQMHLPQNMTLQQQLSSPSYCEPTNYHMSNIKPPAESTLPATNQQTTTDNGPCNN
ncbi:hypothetical protein HA402_003923 [Bradysia odoriphaga]|nr:hypothetical protein HA402_003923 [Bradysia odoriphaga]